MTREQCKGCPYYSSYYHGGSVGTIRFSHRCWWTLKDPEKIQPEECRRGKEEYILDNGLHKMVVAEIGKDAAEVSWHENMGGRWVQLGPAETWSREEVKATMMDLGIGEE